MKIIYLEIKAVRKRQLFLYKTSVISLMFLIPVISFISCSGINNSDDEFIPFKPKFVKQQNDRTLGIFPSESSLGFESSFNKAKEAGIGLVELNLNWNDFEKSKKNYTDPNGLTQAVAFYKANNIKLGLSIANINTVRNTAPDYLKGIDITDSIYIDAYISFSIWLIDEMSKNVEIAYVSLGNESDIYFERDEYFDFIEFFKASYDTLKANYPNLEFSSKCTALNFLFSDKQNLIGQIFNYGDVAMLNYYPQDEGFKVMDPKIVEEHFDEIALRISKDIYFTEAGFQSGTEYCNSSEEKQAQFIYHLFKSWDKHDREIKIININWLHDVTSEQLDGFEQYYRLGDPAFLEYLGTLGLRNYNHTDKYAWEQILLETSLRNFRD